MSAHATRLRGMARRAATLLLCVVACVMASGSAARDAEERWGVHSLTYQDARARASLPATVHTAARAASTWCGAPRQTNLVPNALAGHPVHWVYAIPSDGPDQFSTYASVMQTDAESIDSWWRSQDPLRTLRSDLTQLSCGLQLDLSLIRLSQSGSQLGSIDSRFPQIANALTGLEFSSRHTKYVVYYDGPVEPDICGEGGSDSSGLGFALVYVRACPGVPWNTTAAHELLHTLGAVADGAPHMCPPPDDGHVCENPYDMMFPFGDETPITGLALDSGRDDYYGHSGSWPDMQDSPWLVQLDRQVPLAVSISGPGSVAADVPGLQCGQSCTTTWSAGTALALSATPASGAKLVRWGGACSGGAGCSVAVAAETTVSALFAPAAFRLTVALSGRGSVRSSATGISCRPRCSSLVPSYATLRLTATPAKSWRFKQWRGACKGTKPVCSLPMTSHTNARAVFVRT